MALPRVQHSRVRHSHVQRPRVHRPRVHWATIARRWRGDAVLLLLIALVVALTTAVTASLGPLVERTADRALAGTVADAGSRGAVVATMPGWFDDPRGNTREPDTAVEISQDIDYAHDRLPDELARVVRPGVATVTTGTLQLLDAGPGRYLRLAYVDAPRGPPTVTWTAGGPPRGVVADRDVQPTTGTADAVTPWPVEIAVSEPAATALGLAAGDRLPAEDEHHRVVELVVSGVFTASDPDDDTWQVSTQLLDPAQGMSDGHPRTSAAALVSAASLPDLRFALPDDALTHRISFTPTPSLLQWRRSASLMQAVGELQTSAGMASDEITWRSLLDGVLRDARAQVATARSQAQVLLVGLTTCALLVLVLAGQLLVRRRTDSITLARQRGAGLLGLSLELLVEAVVVAGLGAAVGLTTAWLSVGEVDWSATLPVLGVAAAAAPLLGVVVAGRTGGASRAPANRTARLAIARARRLRRLALEGTVVAATALSYVALRQRGVVGLDDDGDLTAASAPTWWVVAGTLVLLRVVPTGVRLLLRATRSSVSGVPFFVAARLGETAAKALPVLVVTVAVGQVTVAAALAVTEHRGQAEGALVTVGGDARLTAAPGGAVDDAARAVAAAPGVRAAVSARVADDVLASSPATTASVRLVVVDAAGYERLLHSSGLPDAPQLDRLTDVGRERVPALLLGGGPGLSDDPVLRWEDTAVALDVVGAAPRVHGSIEPVVVVDTRAFAAAGAAVQPDTVWAVGPGAAAAVEAAEGQLASASSSLVVRYDEELDSRRSAPLASGLVRLAVATVALVTLLGILGVVLGAAAQAPGRGESLGRLRALGLPDRDVRRVLAGELAAPVVVAAAAGLALGTWCAYVMFDRLSLERITGQAGPPHVVVPWWTSLAGGVLLVAALIAAALEWRRLRRRALAELLRS